MHIEGFSSVRLFSKQNFMISWGKSENGLFSGFFVSFSSCMKIPFYRKNVVSLTNESRLILVDKFYILVSISS
jgi:hypothetical protein